MFYNYLKTLYYILFNQYNIHIESDQLTIIFIFFLFDYLFVEDRKTFTVKNELLQNS